MKKLLWAIPLIVLLGLLTRDRAYNGPVHTFTVTEANFAEEVAAAEGLVAVDFWASWCGPCRRLEPVLQRLAGEYAGRVRVGKVNVDEQPELAQKYRVTGIPTLVLFRDGRVLDRRSGARSEAEYRAWFEEHLGG